MTQENKFIIVREDLVQDPLTLISDGLLIGRLQQCDVLLNHPAVSRAQAGIKEINGTYYLFSLRPSNPPKLNGKEVDENEALAPGDRARIGPFVLEFDREEDDGALIIQVSLQIGTIPATTDLSDPSIGTTGSLSLDSVETKRQAKSRPAPLPGNKTLDIFWEKRIREAGKMIRPSPLFPRGQRRTGKAQFNWTPTSDLARRWPVSFFIWGIVGVGVLSVAAAYWYANAYSPAPLSRSHAANTITVLPRIAVRPNDNSCTSCHSFSGKMEESCSACHKTEAFVATVTEPHIAAGIGCNTCHAEHQGSDFRPGQTALAGCATCHNDANASKYNGRGVRTPHGGQFGYPVVDANWKWKGLSNEDWQAKGIEVARLPEDSDGQWRSKQFHAIHMYRVRVTPGIPGNAQGEMSCSSCHRSFNPIDRETPRTTCGSCHNGKVERGKDQLLIARDKPNCTSCHVEHVKDKRHWNRSLMVAAR